MCYYKGRISKYINVKDKNKSSGTKKAIDILWCKHEIQKWILINVDHIYHYSAKEKAYIRVNAVLKCNISMMMYSEI